MKNKATLNAGEYIIGDVIRYLEYHDLYDVFYELYHEGEINEGLREVNLSRHYDTSHYWIVSTPFKSATLLDENNNPFGCDWGVFGCVPFEWCNEFTHTAPKVKFENSFDVYTTDEHIVIGHKKFKF